MHIDNNPINEESELLSYTLRIYHDFYTKNDITLLLASLSSDVSWCGSGPQMMKTGRTEVMRFFVSTKDKMIPFTFHNESTVVHRLSPHFINITIASDIQTLPSTLLLLKEHLKYDVLYRKNPDCANGIGWEIVHINNSVSYDKLKPDEIFAITEGIWAYQHLTKTPVPSEDKLAFFHLISGKLTSTLSPQELHCLSILSIFDEFTTQGAAAVCIHTDIYALLKKLIHQEFILHHTKTPSTYALYPLIREFLHEKFSLLPKEEQSHYLTRAAQYFLSLQQYTKAMSYANRAGNYSLCLRIFSRGADSILLSSSRTYPMDLLDHIPSSVLRKHMQPVLYILLDLYFTKAHSIYQKIYNRIDSLLTGKDGDIFRELLKTYTSFNHLPSMITHMKNAEAIMNHTPPGRNFMHHHLAIYALLSPCFITLFPENSVKR